MQCSAPFDSEQDVRAAADDVRAVAGALQPRAVVATKGLARTT
jgi:hypothetical protein